MALKRIPRAIGPDVVDDVRVGGYRYVLRKQWCNKARCKTCPHGPYWYLYISLVTGKTVTRYLGKTMPQPVIEARRQAEGKKS